MGALNNPFPEPGWLLFSLEIPAVIWEQMQSQAEARLPEEACGLLAGQGRRVSAIYPLQNQLHSPTRFQLDPGEQLEAFLDIERRGLELLAIYHSHPEGPLRPSSTDIGEAYYPDAAYLIWARVGFEWQCLGFSIREKTVREIKVSLV